MEDLIGKDESFPKVISLIIKNEYNKSSFNKFDNYALLKIMMSKNEFVYNCDSIIKLIFKFSKFSNMPEYMEENLKILQKNENELEVLNSSKMDFLEEIIISFFEYKILAFFKNIQHLDFEKDVSYKGKTVTYEKLFKTY